MSQYAVQGYRESGLDAVPLRAQFRALILRNGQLLRRQKKTLIFQMVFPFLVVLAIGFTRVSLSSIPGLTYNCTQQAFPNKATLIQNLKNQLNANLASYGVINCYNNNNVDRSIKCNNIFQMLVETDTLPPEQQSNVAKMVASPLVYTTSNPPNNDSLSPGFQWVPSSEAVSYCEGLWAHIQDADDASNVSIGQQLFIKLPQAGVNFLEVDLNNTLSYDSQVFTNGPGYLTHQQITSAGGWMWDVSGNEPDVVSHFQVRNFVHNMYMAASGYKNFTISASTGYGSWMSPQCGGMFDVITPMFLYMLPLVMSLMIPMFMSNLVRERQHRYVEMMKMSGLDVNVLWAVNFLFDLALSLAGSFLMYIGFLIFQIDVVLNTNVLCVFLLFLGWGFAMVSLCYFFSSFFADAFRATIFGYIIIILQSTIGGLVTTLVFDDSNVVPPVWYSLYPFLAFMQGLYVLDVASALGSPLGFSALAFGSPFGFQVMFLYIDGIVLMLLARYLDLVLPKQYGVPLSPFFLCRGVYDRIVQHRAANAQEPIRATLSRSGEEGFTVVEHEEDDDCRAERIKVHNRDVNAYVLVDNLTKFYPQRSEPALRNLCLTIAPGECLALLGPNGAGKSTLISVLSGLFPPTRGDADIGGHSVVKDIRGVQKQLGVCPQYDILWDELTVREHLLFYARLKGIARNMEEHTVTNIIEDMSLNGFADKWTTLLSPGMKRKLSIAIALVGSPRFVILDEPTTALDPLSRRNIWDTLLRAKAGRCILLATHSMEEAEVLSSRIAIITRGQLKSIGTHLELKKRYGAEYKVRLRVNSSHAERIAKFIGKICPAAALTSNFAGMMTFSIPREGFQLSSFFADVEKGKTQNGIMDWNIALTSLEEVFVSIVKADEGEDNTRDVPGGVVERN